MTISPRFVKEQWKGGLVFAFCMALGAAPLSRAEDALIGNGTKPARVEDSGGRGEKAAGRLASGYGGEGAYGGFGGERGGYGGLRRRLENRSFPTIQGKPALSQTCHCAGVNAANKRIQNVLEEQLTDRLDFQDTAMEEIVQYLQDEYEIPIQLDTLALDGLGIGSDEPININVNDITLGSALKLILQQLDLAFLIRDEVLQITTLEEAETELKVCLYNVLDLVVDKRGIARPESLEDVLIVCIATDTWAKNGSGEAEIKALPGGILAISQTSLIHKEIRDFLVALRQTRQELPANES